MSQKKIEKHLREEERKTEGSIEITSRNMKELAVLDGYRTPEKVGSVNFWENGLTTEAMGQLLRFKNIIELQLR